MAYSEDLRQRVRNYIAEGGGSTEASALFNVGRTTKLLEEAGCFLLFLPPYSPDFNPIEKTFGCLKNKRPFMPKGISLDELICSIL